VEPECLVPVAGLLDHTDPSGGQLVLAGDPQQLGPVLRSKTAIKYGLQMSFIERLMTQCKVYQQQSEPSVPNGATRYDSHFVTKLIRNYRSHPDILKLPNEMFYDNDLQAMADEMMRSSLCQWEHLPTKGFPIIFEGIVGEDQREEDSPSFFNPQEAIMVNRYIEKLISTRGMIRINAKEIGVISPYKKQVEKIKTMLRAKGFETVKVGSVEEFQGQERRIIIISTVRSNSAFLATDRDYNLGFLDNPKRFNVAITRAKALLIVIGNPKLLSRDKYWNMLLQFVCSRGGYTGIEYSDRSPADEAQSLLERIQGLGLHRADAYPDPPSVGDEEAISEITLQQDPEWRPEH
jgi:helicase MOV-10